MRGLALLMRRLVASSLRRRPVEVVMTVVAIAAATTTLMLGLALHDVTAHPYHTTRALTSGPDIAAMADNGASPSSVAQLDALERHSEWRRHEPADYKERNKQPGKRIQKLGFTGDGPCESTKKRSQPNSVKPVVATGKPASLVRGL